MTFHVAVRKIHGTARQSAVHVNCQMNLPLPFLQLAQHAPTMRVLAFAEVSERPMLLQTCGKSEHAQDMIHGHICVSTAILIYTVHVCLHAYHQ